MKSYKSMEKKYDRVYFERRHLLLLHMAEVIKTLMKKHRLKTVLDVGCGSGLLVKYLRDQGFNAHGCDVSKEAIKMAQKINPQSKIKKASATKLPYSDNFFDLVIAVSVIEHINENEANRFLKEAARVLARNKFIFLVTPNYSTPLRIIQGKNWFGYVDPTHIHYFTRSDLKKILTINGFADPKFEYNLEYHDSIDKEFPPVFSKFPGVLKSTIIYLLFSTPLSQIRNSLWVFAKNEFKKP